jgi:hypothetical protein
MRVAVYNIDQVWANVSVTAKGRLRGHAHRAIRGGNFLKHHCGDRLREGRLLALCGENQTDPLPGFSFPCRISKNPLYKAFLNSQGFGAPPEE